MPKIIWCGNKSWGTDFPENTLPNNAKRIERPDNIFKSSLLYGILPLIFSYAIICIKWFMIGEKAMNPIYVPFGIILGLLLLPVHEVLHGVCYKKGQRVYIGICLKKFAAFAVCHEPISKRRFVIMSLMSYGIGFAIASAFAEQGAKVCFNDINQELVDKGMAAYAAKGIKAHGYVCDVTDEPAVQAMVATIAKEVGTIDILVNNAGIIRRVPMHEMDAADFRRVIDIDLNAPFIVAKAVLPAMMEKRAGKIINICSMMSELGRETVSAYAAAKGGLKMLTRNICSEYGEYNIQCNGIGPGYIATPQTAPLREPQADGSRHPFDSFICAKTPAGRWLDPEELTGPAVFLASEASNAVNGHILYVDGGILAYIGKQPK